LRVEFMRNFNDWEIDGVASFFLLLESHIPIKGENEMEVKE